MQTEPVSHDRRKGKPITMREAAQRLKDAETHLNETVRDAHARLFKDEP